MSQAFRVALPGEDVLRGAISKMIVDSRYPFPKIDTQASPPHAGIIFLNWADTSGIPDGTIKLLCFFPHGYTKMPTVFGSYAFDNGTNRLNGTLPFQNGALGVIFLDADDVNINLKYYSFDQSIPATAILPFLMQIKFYVMAEHGFET